MVFTDIKNSTALWESHAIAMRASIKIHNGIMRKLLRFYRGYEVKTEGDAFMASFQSPLSALQWTLAVQIELLKEDWPTEILCSPDGAEIAWISSTEGKPSSITDSDKILLWRGLCVRMGIHYGTPLCEVDSTTLRMDYFGPMVNRAARICGASQGGQILISSDMLKEVKRRLNGLGDWSEVKDGQDIFQNTPTSTFDRRPSSDQQAQDMDDVNRLKKLGMNLWLIGEMKLKGLETPEILFAVSIIYKNYF